MMRGRYSVWGASRPSSRAHSSSSPPASVGEGGRRPVTGGTSDMAAWRGLTGAARALSAITVQPNHFAGVTRRLPTVARQPRSLHPADVDQERHCSSNRRCVSGSRIAAETDNIKKRRTVLPNCTALESPRRSMLFAQVRLPTPLPRSPSLPPLLPEALPHTDSWCCEDLLCVFAGARQDLPQQHVPCGSMRGLLCIALAAGEPPSTPEASEPPP